MLFTGALVLVVLLSSVAFAQLGRSLADRDNSDADGRPPDRINARINAIAVARERLISARAEVNTAQTDFLQAQQQLRQTLVDKTAARRALVTKAKLYLVHQGTQLEEKLLELRARGLVVSEIDINAVARLRIDANTANDQNKVIRVSKELREKWRNVVTQTYVAHAQRLNQRFLTAITNGKRFVERLEGVVAKLKANGKDTAELERGVAVVKADINALEQLHVDLKAEFEAVATTKEKMVVVYKAKRLLRVARVRFQEDLQLLKKLIVLQRRLNSGTQAEIETATTDATQITAQVETRTTLETEITQAQTQAEIDANAAVGTNGGME